MKLFPVLAALVLAAAALPARAAAPTDPTVADALRAVFGTNRAFTATGRAAVRLPAGAGELVFAVTNAVAGDNLRFDLRPVSVPGADTATDVATLLRSAGLQHFTLLGLDRGRGSFVVYPALRAYAPVDDAVGGAAAAGATQVERTPLGEETVNGRRCQKSRLVLTPARGRPQTVTAWHAADGRGFPVQLEVVADGATVRLNFDQVAFAAPPAAVFGVPAGYTRRESVEELMQELLQNAMSSLLKGL